MQYALDCVQYAENIARLLQCKVNGDLFRYNDCSAAFHIEDSEKYSINIKESGKFAVVYVDDRLVCKSYTDLDTVIMEAHATLDEKFNKNDFDL